MQTSKFFNQTILIASISMALCVALGAFTAHLLRGTVSEKDLIIFETGVKYHFYHSLGLFLVAFAYHLHPSSPLVQVRNLMLGGVVVFSGSLYLLVLTDVRWLGAVTPIGGVLFIVSWLVFAYSFIGR